ncbi:MAG TPA: hypothetical protein VM864_10560 [Pyrinomonadaceae bacterium]|jgi:hypothetical protein|nr:hypothetical protein [Pyrinomonadaceae bacterium]
MTGEEMERAIEFLLKNQAGFDMKLDRLADQVTETSKQVAEMNGRLQMHAESQADFVRVVTSHIEAQGHINADVRTTLVRISEDLRSLATTVRRFAEGRG